MIVDSLSKVPSGARGTLEGITLSPPERGPSLPGGVAHELHWPSFAAGAACVLVLGLVSFGSRRLHGRALRIGLALGAIALCAGAYFGWARRMAGQSGGLLASPEALIDDARDAVDRMNERSREQERVLQELEAER